MDSEIEKLLCSHCKPILAAALEVERTQLAAQAAKERLLALGATIPSSKSIAVGESRPHVVRANKPGAPKPGAHKEDVFSGRRGGTWKEVPVEAVLQNIRGEEPPYALAKKVGVDVSVLRRRVQDIIGIPDEGTRWMKGVGYLVKGKPAWDHERGVLRVDKTKGAIRAATATTDAAVSKVGGRKTIPGPSDDEIKAYLAGKLPVPKLMKRYKCGKGKIYRAISDFKVRFGADAPHSEPKALNGAANGLSNGEAMAH